MTAPDPVEGSATEDRSITVMVWAGGVFLVFLYLFSPFTQVFLGWFVDFEDNRSHKVHEVTFGALFSIIFVGVLVQLRERTRSFPGLVQATVAAVVLALTISATTGPEWYSLLYVAPLGLMIWLHPARSDFRKYRLRPTRSMVWMMALVTAPLLVAFNSEFRKGVDTAAGHEAHWAGMAAFAATLLIIGWMSALGVHGWPIMAITTGTSIAFYSVLSLFYRFDASARPGATAVFGLLWALGFLWIARKAPPQRAVRRDEPRPAWRPSSSLTLAVTFPLLLVGAMGLTIAREISKPPIPHSVESITRASCISCHATGEQGAPRIDLRYHSSSACITCHDRQIASAAEADRASPALRVVDGTEMAADQGELRRVSALLSSLEVTSP